LNELVESLHQTNESIIFHNTNNVIKVLTVFLVVMLPLTFVIGFYGMNVVLPLQNSNNSVLWIVGIMLIILGSMLGYFKYKDWI
jgi:magnesium transporter